MRLCRDRKTGNQYRCVQWDGVPKHLGFLYAKMSEWCRAFGFPNPKKGDSLYLCGQKVAIGSWLVIVAEGHYNTFPDKVFRQHFQV